MIVVFKIMIIAANILITIFNVWNSLIDAHRILDNKKIAHAINFSAYFIFCIIVCIFCGIKFSFWFDVVPHGEGVLFILSAFFNRQLTFDIPLNLRRGLHWYYQSTANPPKALMDRIERFIFGSGQNVGKGIAYAYFFFYCVCLNIQIWVYR